VEFALDVPFRVNPRSEKPNITLFNRVIKKTPKNWKKMDNPTLTKAARVIFT
jgi:hypothetical protein